MKKIISILIFFLLTQVSFADSVFDDLKNNKKTSFLDFLLLKIEQRLVQRHSLMGAQAIANRIQYQSVGSQVDFSEEKYKIIISIIGLMDKKRYTQKKYKPQISDCNILRNILLYGKNGYSYFSQKRNKYLTNADMENIFLERFLNNLSLSENEKKYILNNTFVEVQVIDTVRGNDVFCTGLVYEDLK